MESRHGQGVVVGRAEDAEDKGPRERRTFSPHHRCIPGSVRPQALSVAATVVGGRSSSLRACLLVFTATLGFISVAGCGSAESSPEAVSSVADSPDLVQPSTVVRDFLDAIRRGDDAKASQMLTEVARLETQKHELVVAPPGSETAKFEVGETEFVVKDELVHVSSKWTDIGDDGQPHTDDIVWALRRDTAGWRIAGMATRIFPNEPPLLLDFENPEDMMRQQRMAEEEMQRRAQAADAQATKAPKSSDGNVLRQ
jgi:hypothetical protein